ncbi:MAG: hypothetical protein ACRD0Z_16090 [Acidimicrobiales bacterium]
MIDLDTAEERLRVTLKAVANLPAGALPRSTPRAKRAKARRAGRTRHLLTIAIAVAASGAVAVLLVVPGSRHGGGANRAAATSAAAASTTTTTTTTTNVPSDIQGTEETLVPARAFSYSDSQFSWLEVAVKGTVHAFTVANSPEFEVAELTPLGCDPQPNGVTATESLSYTGRGGGSGSVGPQMGCQPSAPARLTGPTTVEIINNWPTVRRSVFVWPNLPASVAYVTYSRAGKTLFWEKPLDGTAGFSVPWPRIYDGAYAAWHDAPIPVLRAYNSAGGLVATALCPRIGGDDEVRSG